MNTEYTGIDYGRGATNKDITNNIRYGVINMSKGLVQSWCDSSRPYYGEEEDINKLTEEEQDYMEPLLHYIDDKEYSAECGEMGDIFITKALYFTYAQFCSPCAPGACYLTSPLDARNDNNKAYCFGHDMFDDGVAPYPVYSIETGERVYASTAIR